MSNSRIIMGIDPGTQITGYGIIKFHDLEPELLSVGIIDLRKEKKSNKRLKKIFTTTSELIQKYNVNEFAIEAPFFGKNVQSMLKLGKAQGVAIAAALSHDLDPLEYSPRKVKMAVTGNGNASKEQVAVFLKNLLKQPITTPSTDATDGLAVAICHAFGTKTTNIKNNKTKSWEAFVNQNPNRIIR